MHYFILTVFLNGVPYNTMVKTSTWQECVGTGQEMIADLKTKQDKNNYVVCELTKE